MNTKNISDVLMDSLPFIQQFRHKIMVIKYGGAAQINPALKESFARDIALLYMLGIELIIVHGGGKDVNAMLERLQVESSFQNGVRLTSAEAMDVVEMVLSGKINKELSDFLNLHGARAVGISGKDGRLFGARVMDIGGNKEHFTGEITQVDIALLQHLLKGGYVPVISSIAYGKEVQDHRGFNINADFVACEIAKAMRASKVIFLTDTKGVLDASGELISSINEEHFARLRENGVITGGMIPKIHACLQCVKSGVQKAHIIDGRIPHSIILELFTSGGIGTEIC